MAALQPVALISTPYTAAVTASSQQFDLPNQQRDSGNNYQQYVVTNLGTVVVYLAVVSNSVSTVAATGTARGYPLLPGTQQTLTIGAARKVALITASGTADVSLQLASGI